MPLTLRFRAVKSVEESLKIGEAYLAKLSADFTKEENQIRQQKETIAKIKKEVRRYMYGQ